MAAEAFIQEIEQLVLQVIKEEPEYFLVLVKIKPTNNVKVYLDGDNGITIEKCIRFNRALYKLIEESEMFPNGDFSLEVSSPGVGEPLLLHRQYGKNTGRNMDVVLNDDTLKQGKLIEVTNTEIVLEETVGKGKKATTQQMAIPFTNIKKATVQISF
jgi:ribosome maturation factor RimP